MTATAKELDMLKIECRLHTVGGLADALSMMAAAPDMQRSHREALHGLSDAFKDQQQALWRLLFPGDTSLDQEPQEAD